ncbi:MAG TPA: DUF2442 domain-containing protein [Thioploca sp.]|nr:MAG: DUF2442 domain-containing protein [Gammaproteobacteria bacterium]HDN26949.1 DUF2442 domain-containing protein [Thioploca sp.]
MKLPTIKSVKAVDNYNLLVEFSNQQYRLYDMTPLLRQQMFVPLTNPVFFKNVRVDVGGYAVVWNEDIDLSEYELWTHGKPMSMPSA